MKDAASIGEKDIERRVSTSSGVHEDEKYQDAEFGGPEARKKLERKFLLKLDLRMSILVVIYILNYIDRNNAGAARLRGFEEGLHLHGQQFATLLSILYVGYIIMQIPSNMFLNWTAKPSLYLPICTLIWGMISCLTGVTTNFVGALLTRFFLGFVEAAFFPGALFLISKWYKRNELGLRTAILYCGNIISNAFGSLLASGILSGMNGALGHAAWRWLFFIEGALTMTVAVIAIFVLPDFPTTTRWLSPEERALALRRMEEDAGVGDEKETEHGPGSGLFDGYNGLESLVDGLDYDFTGFSPTVTLLLCAPPFIFAVFVSFIVSRLSDKQNKRFYYIVGSYGFGVLGFIIAISTMNLAARYVSLFLMAQSYAGFVVFYAWISNSFPRPPSKRAVALALINAFSQLGNVAGSYVWPSMWGPTYRHSYAICTSTSGLSILMCWIYWMHLGSLNRRLDREEEEKGQTKKGFRYIL